MRKLLILFFLYFTPDLQAQDTLVYYFDQNWRETKPEDASFYGKIFQLNRKLWSTQHYFLDGQLQMQGTITTPKPWGQKEGLFIWYHRNGTPRMRGYYVDNYKIGTWEWWFDNGTLAQRGQYNAMGDPIGFWQRWYSDGAIDFEGNYNRKHRVGDWKWYHHNGQVSAVETYSRGRKLKSIFYSQTGEIITGKYSGSQDPVFAGGEAGLAGFIKSNLIYPEAALADRIGGKVVVQFYIEKDGRVTEPSVLQAAHPLLAEEALRLVAIMPKWQPALSHNRPAKYQYQLPLNFAVK